MKGKRIPKKRKLSSSDEDDLNSFFDSKSGKGFKKSKILKETEVMADKVDTHEQSKEKVMPSTSKDLTNANMKTTKNNSFTKQKTFRPKTTVASQPIHEEIQNSFISMTSSTSESDNEEQAKIQYLNENQSNELEEYQDNNVYMDSMEFEGVMSSTKVNHNESIGSRLQKIEENISTMMKNQSLMLQHFERITSQGVNTHGAPSVHNSTAELRSICPISDEKIFNELEKKLSAYLKEPNRDKEFVKKRALMVEYYKKRIRAVGTAAPKNSLIVSLMEIYFDSKFIDKTCWQETNGELFD